MRRAVAKPRLRNRETWSRRPDSNRRPADYEARARTRGDGESSLAGRLNRSLDRHPLARVMHAPIGSAYSADRILPISVAQRLPDAPEPVLSTSQSTSELVLSYPSLHRAH